MGTLLVTVLLSGCTAGTKPEAGMAARIAEVQRDLRTILTVEAQHQLKSGEAMAVFSYKKGSTCVAGVIELESVISMEGECNAALSPAQSSSDDQVRVVYGYMQPGSAAKVVLRWEDGTEAEAKLGKSAFYYIVEGEKQAGAVSLTAYDKDGKVIQQEAPPAQHKH